MGFTQSEQNLQLVENRTTQSLAKPREKSVVAQGNGVRSLAEPVRHRLVFLLLDAAQDEQLPFVRLQGVEQFPELSRAFGPRAATENARVLLGQILEFGSGAALADAFAEQFLDAVEEHGAQELEQDRSLSRGIRPEPRKLGDGAGPRFLHQVLGICQSRVICEPVPGLSEKQRAATLDQQGEAVRVALPRAGDEHRRLGSIHSRSLRLPNANRISEDPLKPGDLADHREAITMNDSPAPDDLAFVAEFLAQYESDLREGRIYDLAHYQDLFPGREEALAREWARLEDEDGLPARVAHYRIERELGRGGQGRVYLARDENLDRDVALKVLPDHGPLATRRLARFRREAEVAARLDHPGICTVFDSGQSNGVTYIAMRFVAGETLAVRIRSQGEPGAADRDRQFAVAQVIEKAARALHATHEAGILHRDLKPSNLMVTPGGEPIVLDFGLARDDRATDATLTRSDEIFGTPVYMSAEQLRGEALDRRTDIYSLGATLYELLSSRTPFDVRSRESLFQKILTEEPIPLRRRNPHLPRDLCTIVETAMAKGKSQRYRSMEEFADDLQRFREYRPIRARAVGPVGKVTRWARRNPRVALLSVLVVAAVVAGLFLFDDITEGQRRKQEARVQDLILRSWQKLYSADAKRALPLLDEVFRLDPNNVEAIAARTWHDSGDPERALATLDTHLARLGPGDVHADLRWLRAYYLRAMNRDEEAARERARAGRVDSPLRLYFQGLSAAHGFLRALSEEEGRVAVRLFRRAIARSELPRFHFLHSILMTASLIQDRKLMDEAAEDMEFHWPDSPATHDAIGQFYLPVDREKGLRSLRWLVDHTDEGAPYCGLATDALSRGETGEALRLLDQGIAKDPAFAAIHLMRGNLRAQQGDRLGARKDFVRAIELEPQQPYYYRALSGFHRAEKNWDAARHDFGALRARSDTWLAHKAFADACEAMGDLQAALRAFEEVARRRPSEEAGETVRRLRAALRSK